MNIPKISKSDLETWAAFLLDHSLGGITPEDRVMIKGEGVCWPLMEILERRVIEAGAVPDVFLVPPNNDRGKVWSATMGRLGSEEQLKKQPEWFSDRYNSMTKYVEVLGAESPDAFSDLEAAKSQALAEADRTYANIRVAGNWVITLYPTEGFAAIEGMDVQEYADFIVGASTEDPSPLLEAEQKLEPVFSKGKEMRIVTEHPEEKRELCLSLDLSHSRPVMSYGLRNFPDGEIFTSPDARSAEGEIFVDLPVFYDGSDISGIYLKFKDGEIVDYKAEIGHDALAAIIETDRGSHRLGEVALGMNPGMDKVLKHPLFVEKVGGTLHIAIGASYEDCFVEGANTEEGKTKINELESSKILNRSARHVDIVTDFRPGGCGRSVSIDGTKLEAIDGVWVVAG
jgi:aminopeptidase